MLLPGAGVVPAFPGRKPFCLPGIRQEFPADADAAAIGYLRILGGSKEAAKELKLFGLKDFFAGAIHPYLRSDLYGECNPLSAQVDCWRPAVDDRNHGILFAYVFVIWRTGAGALSIGTLTLLAGAIQQASSILSKFSRPLPVLATRHCSLPTCWRSSK